MLKEEREHPHLLPSPTFKNEKWEVGWFEKDREYALVMVDPNCRPAAIGDRDAYLNKRDDYFVAQSIYRGWARVGNGDVAGAVVIFLDAAIVAPLAAEAVPIEPVLARIARAVVAEQPAHQRVVEAAAVRMPGEHRAEASPTLSDVATRRGAMLPRLRRPCR